MSEAEKVFIAQVNVADRQTGIIKELNMSAKEKRSAGSVARNCPKTNHIIAQIYVSPDIMQ